MQVYSKLAVKTQTAAMLKSFKIMKPESVEYTVELGAQYAINKEYSYLLSGEFCAGGFRHRKTNINLVNLRSQR